MTRTEAVNMTRISTFCSDYPQAGGAFPTRMSDSDGNVVCNSNPYGGSGWRYAPGQVNFSQVDYDRTRTGAALTLQYENDAKNLRDDLHGDPLALRESVARAQRQHQLAGGRGLRHARVGAVQAPRAWRPITGSFTFGADGMLDSGVIGQPADVVGFLRRHQRR